MSLVGKGTESSGGPLYFGMTFTWGKPQGGLECRCRGLESSCVELFIFACLAFIWPKLVTLWGYSWLFTQGQLLVGAGDHMGCQDRSQVDYVQGKHSPQCAITLAHVGPFLPVLSF